MPDPAGRGGPAAAWASAALALLLILFALAALIPGTAAAQSLSASTSTDRTVLGRWTLVTLSLDQDPGGAVIVNFEPGADAEFEPSSGMIEISDTAEHVISVRFNRYHWQNQTQVQSFTTSSTAAPSFDGLSAQVNINTRPNKYFRYLFRYGGVQTFPRVGHDDSDFPIGPVLTANVNEEDEIRVTVRISGAAPRIAPLEFTAMRRDEPGSDTRVIVKDPVMQTIPASTGQRDIYFDITVARTGAPAGVATVQVTIDTEDGAFNANRLGRIVLLRVNVSPQTADVALTRPPVSEASAGALMTVSLDVTPTDPVTVSLYADNDDAVFVPAAATIVLQDSDHAAFTVRLQNPMAANVQVTASVFSDNAVFNEIGAVRVVQFTGPIAPVLAVPSSTLPAAWATLTVTYPEDPGVDVVVTVGTESDFIEFGRDPALITVNSGNYSTGGLIRLRATVFGSRTADITASASSANAVFNGQEAEVEFATDSPGSPPDWNVRVSGESAWTTPSALSSLTVFTEVAEGGRASFEFSLDSNWEPSSNVRISATQLASGDARVQRPPFRVVFTPSNFDSVLSMEVTVDATGMPDGAATIEFSLQTDDGPYALWAGQHGSTIRAVVTVRKSVLRVSEFDSVVAGHWSEAQVQLVVPPNAGQYVDMLVEVDSTDSAVTGMFLVDGDDTFTSDSWSDPSTTRVRYTGDSTGEVMVTLRFDLESTCGTPGCTINRNLAGTYRATVTFRPNDGVLWFLQEDRSNRAALFFGVRPNHMTLTMGIAEGSSDTVDIILGGNSNATADAVFSITENAGGDGRVGIVGGPHEIRLSPGQWRRPPSLQFDVTVGNSDAAAAGAAATLQVRLDSDDLAYQAQAESVGYVLTVEIEVEQGPSEIRFSGSPVIGASDTWALFTVSLSDAPPVAPVEVTLTTGQGNLVFDPDPPKLEFSDANFGTGQVISIRTTETNVAADAQVLLTVAGVVDDMSADADLRYGGKETVLTAYLQKTDDPSLSMTQPEEEAAGYWVEIESVLSETPARPVTVSVSSGVTQLEFNPPDAVAVIDGTDRATVSVRYTEASSGITVPLTVTTFSEGLPRFHGLGDSKNNVLQNNNVGGLWVDPSSTTNPDRILTGADPDRITFNVMAGESETINFYTGCATNWCTNEAATVQISVVAGSDPVVEVGSGSLVIPNANDDVPVVTTFRAIENAGGSATIAVTFISDEALQRAWASTNGNTSYLVFNVTPEREIELDHLGDLNAGDWLPVQVSLTSDPRDPVTISFATDPAGSPVDFFPTGAAITMVDSAEYGWVSVRWTDFDSTREGSFDLVATSASGDGNWNGKDATRQVYTNIDNYSRFLIRRSGIPGAVNPTGDTHYITVTVTEGASPSFQINVPEENPAEAGVTISVSLVNGSDPRASLAGTAPHRATFTAGEFGDKDVRVNTSATGGDVGRATVAFILHTDDANYQYVATVHNGLTLYGVVEINPAPAIVASPAGGFTVPSGSDTPVSFSLNAPPSSGAVTVTVNLHNVDTVPSGLNLTLNPAAPAELEFNASNYGEPQEVRVHATTDSLDNDVRFELRMTTHATGDTAFDNLELTLQATVVASPISMEQPANAIAGRWTDVVVALRTAPSNTSNPVTLAFTATGGANVEFSRTQLVLSSTQAATVSVRYAGYLDAAANRNIVATASRAGDAMGENFNGRTASRSVDFQPNSAASWKIEPAVTSMPASVEPSTGHENSLAFELEEGKETVVRVSHMGSLTPTADLEITGQVVSGGDGRASMTPNRVVLTPADHGSGTAREFNVTLRTTRAADGLATLVFTMSTDDGAYSYYGTEHGTQLTAVVTVKQQAPRNVNLTVPTRTLIAGYWHVITVSLSTENSHAVTVDVSASPGANVEFNPSNGKVQIDDHMDEALLSVRWTDVSDNNRDTMVAINARATSEDTTWNGQTSSADIAADNHAPHAFVCYNTTCLRLARTIATLTVSEGTDLGVINLGYNDERFSPSGSFTVIVSLVDGADSRIVVGGGSPREIVFGHYEQRQAVQVSRTGSGTDGEGTVAFIFENDDEGFTYVSQQTSSGTVYFKFEIQSVPAAVVTPSDDLSFPAGEGATLTVQLGSQPSSGMVTVSVGLHNIDTPPAAINLRQMPSSPVDLVFNTSNWNQPLEVTVSAPFVGSADTIDDDVMFEVRITTETMQDSTFDDYELTIPGSVLASPIAMVQPDSVVAGRWTEVELRLNQEPSDTTNPVTIQVAVEGDAANVEFNVNPPTVVLSNTTPESISVRFAGHLSAAATRNLVATASRLNDAMDESFDGETASRSVEFAPNDMASWKIDPDADSTPGSLSPRSGQSPTVTMALAEGLQTKVKVSFEGDVEPVENVNVSGRVLPNGDRRVSMTPSSAAMTPMNFTDGTEHDFDVMLSSSGATNGTATLEFSMTSDDGAYHYNGVENGSRLYVVLTVLRNPLVVDEPSEVIAGRWAPVTVSLRDAPMAGVDVMVDLEVLAPHDSDTEFEGGTDSLVLNASDYSKEVSVRYTGFSADGVAVNLRATSSSSDAAYDGFTFEREVSFSGNPAAWHVYSGANGASPTDMMRAEVTLKVVETKARPFRLSLAVQPTADVEVAVALLPGGDGRIGAPSPSTYTFTAGGSRTIDVDVMAGTTGSTNGFATLRLQMTSDDAAYSLYAGEHGDEAFVEVEVVDTPIDVTEPPDRVAAGRWAVANVALSLEPRSNVTVDLSTAASDVELRPSQLVITPAGFSTGGMVSLRRTANLGADEDVEVNLATRSRGDDDFDALATVIAFEFGSNAEMTISVNEPSSPSAEGQDIEVEVELGADVEPGSQVVVGAAVVAGGDRASLASDRLTFAPGDGMKVFTVNVSETEFTRDPDFDVEVEVSIASGTSDGAFILRDDESSATVAVTDETQGMLSLSFSGALLEIGEGQSESVDVALSVMPTAEVQVALALNPSGAVGVTPAGPLTFNAGNWNRPQPLVLSADNDEIAQGDRDATLELNLSSTDGNFATAAGMPEEIDLRVVEDDVAGVSVSPSGPVRMEAGEELEFSVELTSMPDPSPGNVNVAVALEVDPDAVIPDGLVIKLDPSSPALDFNDGNWNTPQTFEVVAEIPPDTEVEIEEDIEFTVTATPSSSAGGYDSLAPIEIAGVVRRGNKGASQHVGRVMESSAAGIGQLAVDVIGEQVAGGGIPSEASLRLSRAGSAPEERGEAWAGLEQGWRSDFSSLVGKGSGFTMPLGHEGSAQFWARVGYTDYKGTSTFEDEPTEYDGEVFGVVYGVGRRHPGGMVYGLALSHSSSSAELDGDGDLVSTDQDAVSVHPYFGLALGGSSRAWIVGSFGWGGVEVGLDDGSSVETDATSRGVGGGLEARFGEDKNLALRLEGMVGRTELEASEDFERENLVNEDGTPISNEHMRLRAEFEASRAWRLESGRTVHPYLLAAVRHDGGDSNDVTGYELGGGMRAAFDEGYVIDLKARVQVNGGEEHREHTVSGRISYDAGNDRRGLTASFEPRSADGDGSARGRVGYGWGTSLFGQGGVAGPSLSYDSGDGDYVLGFGFDSDRLRVIIDGGSDGAGARLTYRAR